MAWHRPIETELTREPDRSMVRWLVVLSFVAGAALSWSVYVPVVHRAAFELKSNLRAFMFVGMAYFLVAVLIPAIFIFVAKFDPPSSREPSPIFICTPRSGAARLRDCMSHAAPKDTALPERTCTTRCPSDDKA